MRLGTHITIFAVAVTSLVLASCSNHDPAPSPLVEFKSFAAFYPDADFSSRKDSIAHPDGTVATCVAADNAIVGRDPSGQVKWRVKSDFTYASIREVGGLILVQDVFSGGNALLVDWDGHVRLRLDREVITAVRNEHDLLLLTCGDITRTSDTGQIRWTIPFAEPQPLNAGGLLSLKDGDAIAFIYDLISDSGVQVVRFNPTTGVRIWNAQCDCLGVAHSEYQHRASVALADGQILITSKGWAGTFVEALDQQSGRQIHREIRWRHPGDPTTRE